VGRHSQAAAAPGSTTDRSVTTSAGSPEPARERGPETGHEPHPETGQEPSSEAGQETGHAGLLFLLNVANDAAMPDALFDDPELDGVAAPQLLAHLAMTLVPVGDDDPVVLAFAGVDPRRVRPGWVRRLPAPLMERIAAHADGWAAAAAVRLGRPDADPATIVAEIACRSGRIVYEQGWMDVHLRLDDVDIDVRRAGLDIDPGWVPWLGSVVRFCYV
jgi:hypothetical protein